MPVRSAYVKGAAFAAACVFASVFSGSAVAASCIGNCGTASGPDGDVIAPPGGGTYNWISTYGGVTGAGQYAGTGGENGTLLTSSAFSATAGQTLQYFFNYVTSDGEEFADYAWVELQTSGGTHVATLLTAQTQTSGTIIPAAGVAATVDATLTPAAVPIQQGLSNWSPLGPSSGTCYISPTSGCGNTGWVQSDYTVAATGDYILLFGVSNLIDTEFDSGLAIAGVTIGDTPVDLGETPLPASLPLFLSGVAGLGLIARRRKKACAA